MLVALLPNAQMTDPDENSRLDARRGVAPLRPERPWIKPLLAVQAQPSH
jgi:hypothetical protein